MMRLPPDGKPGLALRALAAAYGAAADVHGLVYDRGLLRPYAARVPVVSAGNLVAGGTGKTPCVIWLAGELHRGGARPVILTRGYGRRSVGTEVIEPGRPRPGPDVAGDEPLEIAARLPEVPIIIGRDRRVSASLAVGRFGAGCLVLDDGFQYRPLRRDFDLVLLDAARPFGNGRRLPAGPLREPPGALKRASAILLTRADGGVGEGVLRRLEELAPEAWIGTAAHEPAGFRRLVGPAGGGGGRPAGPVIVTAGIGAPESVSRSAAQCGLEVAGSVFFPDHHRYAGPDYERVRSAARGRAVVTTGKDAVRWGALDRDYGDWWVLEVVFGPRDPQGLLERVERALAG